MKTSLPASGRSRGSTMGWVFVVLMIAILAALWWWHRSDSGAGSGGGSDPVSPLAAQQDGTPAVAKSKHDESGTSPISAPDNAGLPAEGKKPDHAGAARKGHPDFDRRAGGAAQPTKTQNEALAKLKVRYPNVDVRFDPVTGSADHVMLAGRFLGEGVAGSDDPYASVKNFIEGNSALFGHDGDALNEARVTREDAVSSAISNAGNPPLIASAIAAAASLAFE